jgi:DNA polymerase (family 10)
MNVPSNATIAAGLERIAELLELEGVEATPVAAYRRAGQTIAAEPRPMTELIDADGVDALHALGIGWWISGLVTDWIRSGELPLLQRLERRHDPETRLRRVPGIGPKLAHEVRELGINSVDALATAARSGRLQGVCGFGPKRIALIKATLRGRPLESPVQLELLSGA